jgi:hypothetical protein
MNKMILAIAASFIFIACSSLNENSMPEEASVDTSGNEVIESDSPEFPEVEDSPQIVGGIEEWEKELETYPEFIPALPEYFVPQVAAEEVDPQPEPEPEPEKAPVAPVKPELAGTSAPLKETLPKTTPVTEPALSVPQTDPESEIAPESVPPPSDFSPPVRLPARIHPTETEPKEKETVSRVVRAVVGQLIEIPYWGAGWIFLGEVNARQGLSYDSRRLDREGQSFIFRAEKIGEYALKFNKQDFVNNYYINDIVKVIVGENTDNIPQGYFSGTRVIAEPRWRPTVSDSVAARVDSAAESGVGAARSSENAPQEQGAESRAVPPAPRKNETENPAENAMPEMKSEHDAENNNTPLPDYLSQAHADFKAGKFPEVISSLDLLRGMTPALDDEVWWLYGQSFEANSPARDIKAALDSYRHITQDFPQSVYYDPARGRIAYLNKFYFDIR